MLALKRPIAALVCVLCLKISFKAHADLRLTNRQYGVMLPFKKQVDTFFDGLEKQFNTRWPNMQDLPFAKNSVPAHFLSSRGLSVSHLAPPQNMVQVATGLGIGIGLEGDRASKVKGAGTSSILRFGIQGTKLQKIFPFLEPFAERSYFYFTFNPSIGKSSQLMQLDQKSNRASLNWQYLLVKGIPYSNYNSWAGIFINGGIDYLKTVWSVQKKVHYSQNFQVDSYNLQGTVDGNVKANVQANLLAAPFEVSTGLYLGKIFALFGGWGMSYITGSAKLQTAFDGTFTTMPYDLSATPELDFSLEGKNSRLIAYFFMGPQINFGDLKINLQLTHGQSNYWGLGLLAQYDF